MTPQLARSMGALWRDGVRFVLSPDGRIGWRGPPHALTPGRVDALRGISRELAQRAKRGRCLGCDCNYYARPTVCYWCRGFSEQLDAPTTTSIEAVSNDGRN